MRIGLIVLFLVGSFYSLLAHPGISIVQNSNGIVYYTDLVHVWRIHPNGVHEIAVKDVHTHLLFLDEEDNLYGEHSWYEGEATDKWGYLIWKLDTKGKLEYIVPPTEGFPKNNQLVRDRTGNQYWPQEIIDHEVLMKTTPDGEAMQFSTHKFEDIRWISAAKDRDFVFVVDMLSLKKVDAAGNVEIIVDNLKEEERLFNGVRDMHYVMGIWNDESGYIYAAVYGDRVVKRIAPDGEVSNYLISPRGWSPSGGFIDVDGSLWVLEYSIRNKARVRKICLGGETEVYEQ